MSAIACGACCKYRLDNRSGYLLLACALGDGVVFATNDDFIPRAGKSHGDEIDLLVLIKIGRASFGLSMQGFSGAGRSWEPHNAVRSSPRLGLGGFRWW